MKKPAKKSASKKIAIKPAISFTTVKNEIKTAKKGASKKSVKKSSVKSAPKKSAAKKPAAKKPVVVKKATPKKPIIPAINTAPTNENGATVMVMPDAPKEVIVPVSNKTKLPTVAKVENGGVVMVMPDDNDTAIPSDTKLVGFENVDGMILPKLPKNDLN